MSETTMTTGTGGGTGRILWMDISKAAAAWMVVTAHLLRQGVFTDYLAAVAVAMFYMLAGATLHVHTDWRTWLRRLAQRIVLPYLAVGLISIVIYRILGSYAAASLGTSVAETTLPEDLWHLLYGSSVHGWMKWNESLWFLPSYCVMILMAEGIEHVALRRKVLMPILYVAGGVAGYLLITVGTTGLPWHLETALLVLPLCGYGRYLRLYQIRKRKNAWETALVGLVLLYVGFRMYSGLLDAAGGSFSLRSPQLADPIRTYVFLICTCVGIFTLVWYVTRGIDVNAWVVYPGQNSLDIVLWNKFPVLALQVLLPLVIPGVSNLYIGGTDPRALIIAALLAIPCIALCLVWATIYQRAFVLLRH